MCLYDYLELCYEFACWCLNIRCVSDILGSADIGLSLDCSNDLLCD